MPGPLTADAIVDRVRSLLVGAPYSLGEAVAWSSFDQQPDSNIDGVFRIPPPSSQRVVGGYAFAEERTDSMQVWVARKRNGDYDAVRRALLRDVHSLTAGIVRDGAITSGDYNVPDEGRGHAIVEDTGKDYVTLRLTLPLNYDAQL